MNRIPDQADKVRKTLRYSVLEGSAYSASLGLTQDYVAPFALVLGATTTQIGLLASMPSLSAALSQLAGPFATERAGSRKGFILPAVLLHALVWIPVLFLPHLALGNKVWWLIGLLTLGASFASIVNPAWGSLMADLIPARLRGRYFGFRGRVSGLSSLLFFFIGGAVLYFFPDNLFIGFSILFGCAAVSRLMSWYFMARMYEPPQPKPVEQESLLHILKKPEFANLGRFTIYVSLMNFSVSLAGPFFAVYMLRDLGFDYITFVIITATATLANMVFLTFWGKRADMAGNIRVLKFTSIIVPIVPILWIASSEVYYLIPLQILSGFAWAGFNLSSTNFIYDASVPANRTRCIALFAAVNGSAMCLGALLGGLLAVRLPPVFGHSLLTLFLLSGLLRMLVALTLLRNISEVRRVPGIPIAELLLGRGMPRMLRAGFESVRGYYLLINPRSHRKPSQSHQKSTVHFLWDLAKRSPP